MIPKETVFPAAEYEERRRNVRTAMNERGIDVLITHSAPNVYYLCGHHTLNLWDYQCLVLPLASPPFMVLWHFERGRFEASATDTEAMYYETLADPVEHTVESLRTRGLLRGNRVGLDSHGLNLLPYQYQQLRHAIGDDAVVDSVHLVERVRMIKSPAELDIMRRAAALTDRAMQVAFDTIGEGVPDTAVSAAVAKVLLEEASLAFAVHPMVAAGYRAGVPHSTSCGRRIERGETVFLEWSPTVNWYNASLIRTAVVGEPPARARDYEAVAREAIETICANLRPGTPAEEVAAAGRRILEPLRSEITFHHFYGYPTGIGFPPTWEERSGFFITAGNPHPVETGMTFHVPINLRVHGEWGVGMSQTVTVTAAGGEALSRLPLDLTILGDGTL